MHREILYVEHTKEGYEELYKTFKEEETTFDLDWITWQLDDQRFITKEQAFDILYFFINKFSEEKNKEKLKLDFTNLDGIETSQEEQVINFECTPSNFGSQILAFNNDEIDVILRNQKKGSRSHNDTNKTSTYKIIIKKV